MPRDARGRRRAARASSRACTASAPAMPAKKAKRPRPPARQRRHPQRGAQGAARSSRTSYGVAADVWSVTSYKELLPRRRRERALEPAPSRRDAARPYVDDAAREGDGRLRGGQRLPEACCRPRSPAGSPARCTSWAPTASAAATAARSCATSSRSTPATSRSRPCTSWRAKGSSTSPSAPQAVKDLGIDPGKLNPLGGLREDDADESGHPHARGQRGRHQGQGDQRRRRRRRPRRRPTRPSSSSRPTRPWSPCPRRSRAKITEILVKEGDTVRGRPGVHEGRAGDGAATAAPAPAPAGSRADRRAEPAPAPHAPRRGRAAGRGAAAPPAPAAPTCRRRAPTPRRPTHVPPASPSVRRARARAGRRHPRRAGQRPGRPHHRGGRARRSSRGVMERDRPRRAAADGVRPARARCPTSRAGARSSASRCRSVRRLTGRGHGSAPGSPCRRSPSTTRPTSPASRRSASSSTRRAEPRRQADHDRDPG